MSIKFKQNGEWVKIPTPSQIDDTAASSATTYSSNKINEIIPKDIAEYIEEHKEEIGTTDFNKLKNVPFTTITEADKDNYNTLDKLCYLSDGVYLYTGSTAIELKYKSQDTFLQSMGETGTQVGSSTVYDEDIFLENGTIFGVSSNSYSTDTKSHKSITIVCGVRSDNNEYCGSIFIDAYPDSGTGTESDPYTYGTTGASCSTIEVNKLAGYSAHTLSLFKNVFTQTPKDGQVAQFVTDTTSPLGVTIQGADVGSSVPITVINADNKDNFTTLDKICHQPDGLYIVDDCGTTSPTQDYEFEIDGIKGYDMAMGNLGEAGGRTGIVESQSIRFKKGSTLQIYSWSSSRRKNGKRVNIYNTEGGQGYDADHDELGNLNFFIETSPESGTGTEADPYVYGVTGETTYYMDSNESNTLDRFTQSFCLPGILDSEHAGEATALAGIAEGGLLGMQLVQVDKSNFQSPFTIINNDNADNYNTLDKLCHLDDGIYICKDEYSTAKKDYIVEVSFKGISYADAAATGFSGDSPTPDSNGTTKCKNGAIISVVAQTNSTKNKVVRITHGLNGDVGSSGNGFDDIYIIAAPDDSSASTLVYGVTGANTFYYRPVSTATIYGTLFPFSAMANTLLSGDEADGKMAVWKKDNANAEMPMLSYADIPSSPINIVNDDNWSNFDTLQKWFNADPGVYYIDCTPTWYNEEKGYVKSYKTISAAFHFSDCINGGDTVTVTDGVIEVPYKGVVYVTSTDRSGGAWYRDLHVYFPNVSDVSGTGINYGNVSTQALDFEYNLINGEATVDKVTAANVKLVDYGLAAGVMPDLMEMVLYMCGVVVGSISSSDIGRMVKIGSPSSSYYGNEFEFQAVDISLIGSSTDITPTQVRDAINEGEPVTISYTDTTYGTLKFTGFGTVSTASGDTVSASITYGSATDSFMLFTLIGDVTGGTWTMYSRSVPTMESIG